MKIIIPPAKKMKTDTDAFEVLTRPVFLNEAGTSSDPVRVLWCAGADTGSMRADPAKRNMCLSAMQFRGSMFVHRKN